MGAKKPPFGPQMERMKEKAEDEGTIVKKCNNKNSIMLK